MYQPAPREIAAFPELFGEIEQFMDETSRDIRQFSLKMVVIAIPACSVLTLVLGKLP